MLRISKYLLFCLLIGGLAIVACKKDPEEEEEPEVPELEFNTSVFCDNSCYFSEDGECDDGGYGSTSSLCKFGTDCADCGKRIIKKIKR